MFRHQLESEEEDTLAGGSGVPALQPFVAAAGGDHIKHDSAGYEVCQVGLMIDRIL